VLDASAKAPEGSRRRYSRRRRSAPSTRAASSRSGDWKCGPISVEATAAGWVRAGFNGVAVPSHLYRLRRYEAHTCSRNTIEIAITIQHVATLGGSTRHTSSHLLSVHKCCRAAPCPQVLRPPRLLTLPEASRCLALLPSRRSGPSPWRFSRALATVLLNCQK